MNCERRHYLLNFCVGPQGGVGQEELATLCTIVGWSNECIGYPVTHWLIPDCVLSTRILAVSTTRRASSTYCLLPTATLPMPWRRKEWLLNPKTTTIQHSKQRKRVRAEGIITRLTAGRGEGVAPKRPLMSSPSHAKNFELLCCTLVEVLSKVC